MTTQTSQAWGGPGGEAVGSSQGPTDAPAVRERAAEVGGTARDEAAGVAREATAQARDLVGEARSQLRQQADTQKGHVVDLLRQLTDDLEQMASAGDRPGIAGDLVRQAASRARDAREYLEGDGDPVADVRRFARRRPGTFLIGALAAGVLAGRATRGAVAAHHQPSGDQGPRAPQVGSPGYQGEYAGYPQGGYAQPAGSAQPAGYATGAYASGRSGFGQDPQGDPYAGADPAGYTAPSGYREPREYAEPGQYGETTGAYGTEPLPAAHQGVATATTSPGSGYAASPAGIQRATQSDDALSGETEATATGYAGTTGTVPETDADQPVTGRATTAGPASSTSRGTGVPPEGKRQP